MKTYQITADICRRCHTPITDRTAKRDNIIWYCLKCKKKQIKESRAKSHRRVHPKPTFKVDIIISTLQKKPTTIDDLKKITGIKTEATLKTMISFLRNKGYKITSHRISQSFYVMENPHDR